MPRFSQKLGTAWRVLVAIVISTAPVAAQDADAQQSPQSPVASQRPSVNNRGAAAGTGGAARQQRQQQNRNNVGGAANQNDRTGNTQRPLTLDPLSDANVRVGGNIEEQQLHVIMGEDAFEPLTQRELDYGPIPPAPQDLKLSLLGPMLAVEFLDALSVATNWNIVASPSLAEINLNFWLSELTPEQAMGVLRFNDLYYNYDRQSDLLFVTTKEEHIQRIHGTLIRSDFKLNHADLKNVESGVAALLSARGRMVSDPRTSTIIVFDTEENLEHMARLVDQLDRERVSRTYEIRYANGSMLFDSVEVLLSEGGQMSYDPRSNTLIVLDREQQQKQIEQTIRILDMPVATRTWVLNNADAELVAEHLLPVVPENMGTISANSDLRQITVTAIQQRLDEVEERIREWDKERPQVQIEAYLVTVSSSVARNIGFNWNFVENATDGVYVNTFGSTASALSTISTGTTTGNGDSGGTTSGTSSDVVNPGLTSTYAANDGDVSAVLDVLETNGDATILAHPRVTVQDGQEALFENTTEVPFATSSVRNNINASNDNVVTTTRVDFIDVGTILRVIPRITVDRKVLMDISSEDSSFVIRDVISNDKVTSVPEKTQNLAETQVLAEDQQTIIIGGLRTSNFNDGRTKVPILGDIPIIGRIFRSTTRDHDHKELLVFITPTIINGRTQPEAMRLARVDQRLADTLAIDRKSDAERAFDNFFGKDINVSVGQHGTLLVDGEITALETLRSDFRSEKNKGKTVVIRSHPRADSSITDVIIEAAMEADLKFEIDESPFPFVPNLDGE